MNEQLRTLLDQLAPFGFDERTLLLAQAMKNMKDTGYGNLVTLPIANGAAVGFDIKIDRSDFAWKWLFYCIDPEDTGLNFDFSIDIQFGQDRRAFKGPIAPLAPMYGNPRVQLWKIFNPPVVIPHETTVNVEIVNRFPGGLAQPIQIQVWLMGNEKATV